MRRLLALLPVMLAAAPALAHPPAPREPGEPLRLLRGVPDVMQANNYSCGVGVAQAVAQYYGIWGYHEHHVAKLGTTPEDGTHPARIAAYMRRLGLRARLVEGLTPADLRRWVDRGVPVIIDFQAWNADPKTDYRREWEDGHYGIVVGYNREVLFIEDPSILGTLGWLTDAELEARWHDYEDEPGGRREYRRLGVVVEGRPRPPRRFTHID